MFWRVLRLCHFQVIFSIIFLFTRSPSRHPWIDQRRGLKNEGRPLTTHNPSKLSPRHEIKKETKVDKIIFYVSHKNKKMITESTNNRKRQKRSNDITSTRNSSPIRCINKLYTALSTYECAIHGQEIITSSKPNIMKHQFCVPCTYKIGAFDVALDEEFTRWYVLFYFILICLFT